MSPTQAAALLGAAHWNLAALAAQVNRSVKIKVPLGLDDPMAYTPASNRPTVGKWQLGKELFFDKNLFLQPATDSTKTSCASCHDPAKGFTDAKIPGPSGFVTPRLVNSAYFTHYYWDGRAGSLEEAIEQSIAPVGEAEKTDYARPHRWTGTIERLREDTHYTDRFRRVFGAPPTEDAVAKALATYLRTVLSGNSLQDRAERQRAGKVVEASDYEKLLDVDTMKDLRPDPDLKKDEVAKQLQLGYSLFHGKANCSICHKRSNYSDDSFHNLGIRESGEPVRIIPPGRFSTLPVGLKDRRMIGAFKTPSLRSLPRGGPFFHDGLRMGKDGDEGLQSVIIFYEKGCKENSYLDPVIKKLNLETADIHALVMFLKALEGEPPADEVTKPPLLPPNPKK
jgi:cytochrome c peroxidase